MKKFEVINSKWIKQLDFENEKAHEVYYTALNVDSISGWHTSVFKWGEKFRHEIKIFSSNPNLNLKLIYNHDESKQYAEDILTIETLLVQGALA